MSLLAYEVPDWYREALDYIFTEGLRGTLIIAGVSVTASAIVGVLLGTLMTIHFRPLRALIRLYIELWRGLPIIVTIFLIFFALPRGGHPLQRLPGGGDRALALGQRAGGGGHAWGGRVDPARATRGPRRRSAGWVGRHVFVIVPQALRRLLPPMVSLLVNVPRTRPRGLDRRTRTARVGQAPGRAPRGAAAGRHRRDPCARDLRNLAGDLLPDLLPAHATGRLPRATAGLGTTRARERGPSSRHLKARELAALVLPVPVVAVPVALVVVDLAADLAARVLGGVHVRVHRAPAEGLDDLAELACGDPLTRGADDVGHADDTFDSSSGGQAGFRTRRRERDHAAGQTTRAQVDVRRKAGVARPL